MNESGFKCTGLPDFPINVSYAAGGIVNGIPIICGGANSTIYDNNTETILTVYQNCYEFKKRAWKKTEKSLDVPKYNLATGNLVIKDKLLIHGGQTDEHNFVNSSELIGLNTQSSNDTLPVSGHCIIMINETYFMVTGGMIPDGNGSFTVTNKTFFCRTDLKNCIPGTPLNHQRTAHSCYQKKPYLNVVGGYIDNYKINSTYEVEKLNLTDNSKDKKWTLGKYS